MKKIILILALVFTTGIVFSTNNLDGSSNLITVTEFSDPTDPIDQCLDWLYEFIEWEERNGEEMSIEEIQFASYILCGY